MRGDIIEALFKRMAHDERVFFLTADMGINLVERFQEAYPARFLNVGIAEQSLIGVSSGLYNAGFRPVAYTISNFLVHRCFEQIRNDIALHDYPVILLGTSAGFDNAPLGPTHHIIDDWGHVAALPGVDVYCPSSVPFARSLLDRLLDGPRPAYVRIPKGTPAEPASDEDFVYLSGAGPGPLLVSYGGCVQACLKVQAQRPNISVLICNRLTRLKDAHMLRALADHDRAIVVEDHHPEIGLFGALCRLCMSERIFPKLESLSPRGYCLTVGASSGFYERRYNMDEQGISAALAA